MGTTRTLVTLRPATVTAQDTHSPVSENSQFFFCNSFLRRINKSHRYDGNERDSITRNSESRRSDFIAELNIADFVGKLITFIQIGNFQFPNRYGTFVYRLRFHPVAFRGNSKKWRTENEVNQYVYHSMESRKLHKFEFVFVRKKIKSSFRRDLPTSANKFFESKSGIIHCTHSTHSSTAYSSYYNGLNDNLGYNYDNNAVYNGAYNGGYSNSWRPSTGLGYQYNNYNRANTGYYYGPGVNSNTGYPTGTG